MYSPGELEPNFNKLLTRFKAALLKRHICQPFGTQDQLATKVVADIGRHLAMQVTTRVGLGIPVQDTGLESLRGSVTETPDDWKHGRKSTYEEHRGLSL
jgi:hypothetical protein